MRAKVEARRAKAGLLQREALVDLGEGQLNLLLADRMGCGFGLSLEIRFGQTERLELAYALGINLRSGARATAPLCFALFDLFLDSCFRVDETFSGITHKLTR